MTDFDTPHSVTMQSVRAGELLLYNHYPPRTDCQPTSAVTIAHKLQSRHNKLKANRQKAYSGLVSKGVAKRLRKAIDLLISSTPTTTVQHYTRTKTIKHKLSFITLTIPDLETLTGKEAHKKLLEPMLLWLRRYHGLRSYIWKAELQKRGQLHYHITSNVYIAHQELKDKWNELLTLNNYNRKYREEKGHTNANSTDIKEVRKISNLGGYLTKYFTKAYQNEKSIGGKVWDCSLNLKRATYFTEQASNTTFDILTNPKQYNDLTIKYFDRCTIIKITKGTIDRILDLQSIQDKQKHYNDIWNYKRTTNQQKQHEVTTIGNNNNTQQQHKIDTTKPHITNNKNKNHDHTQKQLQF